MTTQDEMMEFARESCVCGIDTCLDEDCPACGSIDPELPCPITWTAE